MWLLPASSPIFKPPTINIWSSISYGDNGKIIKFPTLFIWSLLMKTRSQYFRFLSYDPDPAAGSDELESYISCPKLNPMALYR